MIIHLLLKNRSYNFLHKNRFEYIYVHFVWRLDTRRWDTKLMQNTKKKLYPRYLVLVGSRNGFESDLQWN